MQTFDSREAAQFRAGLREWLSDAVPTEWREHGPALEESRKQETRRDWERAIWAAGYAGLSWPAEYGGCGLGPVADVIFYEECAIAHAPPELDTVGKFLAGPAIIENGTDEQKKRYLRKILSATEMWCEGFSEPSAGSDLAAVRTTASFDGSVYRIEGEKVWTSHANLADHCYLLARTAPDAPRRENLTVFLLDMHQPGIHISPIRQITGESHFAQVHFDGATAKPTDVLGKVNDGWRLSTLTGFRSARQSVDAMRRYVEMMTWVDQYETCLAECGVTGTSAGSLRERLHVLRWHTMRATETLASGRSWYPLYAMMKLTWSELMQDIATAGDQLQCPTHFEYWRHCFLESRASTIYGGPIQIQRDVIAKRVLSM